VLLVAGCGTPSLGAPSRSDLIAKTAWPDATPSAPPADVPALSRNPALADLLRIAMARNPKIHAARERAAAASETPAVAGALPDPKLMLGWYASPVETRVGPQRWSLRIQQDIPWPGKLSARSGIGEAEARRSRVIYERAVRDVLVEVTQTAYELVYLDNAIRISSSIVPLLERYVAAASGSEPLAELFRAETQRAQLENDRVVLAELRAAEAEHLKSLLDMPPHTPLETPRIGETPPVEARYEELLAIAQTHNQELRAAGLAREAAALRTTLARRSRLPDLSIGYSHIFTDALNPAIGMPPNSGQDAQIVHFGISLPLWFGKNNAAVRRAQALERAALREQQGARLSLRHGLARVWYQLGNAKRLTRLYGEVLVPRAERSAATAEDLLRTGKGSLAGTVETIAVLHNFRLAQARARADYGQAVAALEAILGRPLAAERREP